MPPTPYACLDDVRVELVGTTFELSEISLGGDAPTVRRESSAEHIGDEHKLHLFTDWARDAGRGSDILCCSDQLGVGVTQLLAPEAAATIFIDERAAFETVIDDRSGTHSLAVAIPTFAKCVGREGHSGIRLATATTVIRVSRPSTNNTCSVTTVVRYGASVADESELRLCGDVAGKRVIELGIGAPSNAVALAAAGARAMAVDPSSDRIALLRRQAEQAEVTVQCHHGDVADLGFATSGSIDLVVASHTLQEVDDLARLLRQIHRVLRPEAPFVMAGPHPIAAMLTTIDGQQVVQRAYGAGPARSISDIFMAMQRTNFRIDVIHELAPVNTRAALTPAVLVIRARKLGV